MLRIRASGLSDVGRARTHNEDCFGIDPEHRMFVVADGMGGHNHGEVASRIAVKAIQEFVEQTAENDTTWPFVYDARLQRHSNRLKTAIRMAHDKVLRAIRHDGSLIGMGTTVVGFLLKGRVAAVAHVGDSRVYRWRDRKLELLTQDHTWVNEQVVAGYLSAEQARAHPLKNVVTRALTGGSDPVIDVHAVGSRPGDRLLACSDGLSCVVASEHLARLVGTSASPEDACRALIEAANLAGGPDNITVAVLYLDVA